MSRLSAVNIHVFFYDQTVSAQRIVPYHILLITRSGTAKSLVPRPWFYTEPVPGYRCKPVVEKKEKVAVRGGDLV